MEKDDLQMLLFLAQQAKTQSARTTVELDPRTLDRLSPVQQVRAFVEATNLEPAKRGNVARIPAQDLYRAFLVWAEHNGINWLTDMNHFGRQLATLALFNKRRAAKGVIYMLDTKSGETIKGLLGGDHV